MIPGSFEEFADQVLPVLRERGLAQREYARGATAARRLFGAPRLNDRHPAARYRGAFGAAAGSDASAPEAPDVRSVRGVRAGRGSRPQRHGRPQSEPAQ